LPREAKRCFVALFLLNDEFKNVPPSSMQKLRVAGKQIAASDLNIDGGKLGRLVFCVKQPDSLVFVFGLKALLLVGNVGCTATLRCWTFAAREILTGDRRFCVGGLCSR